MLPGKLEFYVSYCMCTSWPNWKKYVKCRLHRTVSVFCLAFSVSQSRKTVSSIEIDGHGSTGIKLEENGNNRIPNMQMCKQEIG